MNLRSRAANHVASLPAAFAVVAMMRASVASPLPKDALHILRGAVLSIVRNSIGLSICLLVHAARSVAASLRWSVGRSHRWFLRWVWFISSYFLRFLLSVYSIRCCGFPASWYFLTLWHFYRSLLIVFRFYCVAILLTALPVAQFACAWHHAT